MILRRNVDAVRRQILDRMVTSAVAVLHLVRVSSRRKRHELMSQADCKNRCIGFIQLADLCNDLLALFRVSRSVAQHDTVRVRRQNLLRRSMCRVYRHLTASLS